MFTVVCSVSKCQLIACWTDCLTLVVHCYVPFTRGYCDYEFVICWIADSE